MSRETREPRRVPRSHISNVDEGNILLAIITSMGSTVRDDRALETELTLI